MTIILGAGTRPWQRGTNQTFPPPNIYYYSQGRPVSVKHGARCAMDKVGGKTKTRKGETNLIYRYNLAVIS